MVVCDPTMVAAAPTCSINPLAMISIPCHRYPVPQLVPGSPTLAAHGQSSSPVLPYGANLNTLNQFVNPPPVTYTSKSPTNPQVITTFIPMPISACGQKLVPCDPSNCPSYHQTLLPPGTGICAIPTTTALPIVPSWKQSYGMEQVWQCEFKNLFSQYAPHVWMLLPVTQKPSGPWNSNVDSAKVRFCCERCGHGWTSMKGRVAFWFVLNPTSGEGMVCLKLYGQQCDRCKLGHYEPAMWYPEEVIKVLVNIYNRVGQAYYGFQQAPYHRTRRPGKPRTPHNAELCQACKDGVCSERK